MRKGSEGRCHHTAEGALAARAEQKIDGVQDTFFLVHCIEKGSNISKSLYVVVIIFSQIRQYIARGSDKMLSDGQHVVLNAVYG